MSCYPCEFSIIFRECNVFPFSAENQWDDPVCQLDRFERLRVCTLVFSSEYFGIGPKFIPTLTNVDASTCMKNEISFQDKQNIGLTGYEEWMIICRVQKNDTDPQPEYFLSGIFNSSNVFLYYRRRDSKVVIQNMFSGVRFRIQENKDL